MTQRTVNFGGQVWALPAYATTAAAAPTACKSCAAPILWVTTVKGGRAPLNQDGTSHFANCPQANQWRGTTTVGG